MCANYELVGGFGLDVCRTCTVCTRGNRGYSIRSVVHLRLIPAIKRFDHLPRWSLSHWENLTRSRALIAGGMNLPLFARSGKWQSHSFTLRLFCDRTPHTLCAVAIL